MSKTENANTATDVPQAAPAVGALLERGVGRLEPKRMKFADVCALMPEGVYWGEHLTPQIARELVEAGVYAERKRWEAAMHQTWQMVDPLKPAGQPGSYWRGQDAGIAAALTTLRANLKPPNVRANLPP
jgi:hypothetical protein